MLLVARAARRWRRSPLTQALRASMATDSNVNTPTSSSSSSNGDGNRRVDTAFTADDLVDATLPTSALLLPASNRDWQVVRAEHFQYVPVPADWDEQLKQLQKRIGVMFRDPVHLKCALTHSGAFPLNGVPDDVPAHRLANRSLEFLGDSILGMAVASFVFQAQPTHQEGQLTRAKSALVNNDTLSKICERHLQMHELIVVASDYSLARRSGRRQYIKGRTTIQAGAVEALIAAIYMDQGLEAALDFANRHVLPHAVAYAKEDSVWDPLGELQNLLQSNGIGQPVYKHLPASVNSKEFAVSLIVQGKTVAAGTGPSYKAARIAAADAGYAHFARQLGVSESQ